MFDAPDPTARGTYREVAYGPNTARAYDADWRHFLVWCDARQANPLPADPRTVAAYLIALVQGVRAPGGQWIERPRKVTTLARRLATIRHCHRSASLPFDARDATLQATWRGIQRIHARPPHGKVPTVTELVRALLAALPVTTAGVRDRALLLVGFAGALRRSELVAIEVSACAWHREGVVITVPQSTTQPDGPATDIGLPYGEHPETCPVRALAHWLAVAKIDSGPVFRPVSRQGSISPRRLSDRGVALIIKRAVAAARTIAHGQGNLVLAESLDPARYAGHSLRAGFIISAAAAGVPEHDIMRHTRHKSADTLRRYIEQAALFRRNAAAHVGL